MVTEIECLRGKFRNYVQELAECVKHEDPKYWYDGGWPELQDLIRKYLVDTRRERAKVKIERGGANE